MRWLLLLFLACTLSAAEATVGSLPPPLPITRTLNNPAGKGPVALDAFLGKVVLIDFWATWCGPCKAAIPHVRELHEKYGEQGLVVIGHTDETSQGLDAFVKSFPIPYLVTVGGDVFKSWGVSGIPCVFLLDVDGRIAWRGHPAELKEKTITDLLAKVKPSGPPAPRFAAKSPDLKVAVLEQQAAAGKVGSAVKALEKLDSDAAKADLAVIAKWQAEQDAAIDQLTTSGDVYGAWKLADTLADAYRGSDTAKTYQDRAATIKKDPAYEIGKAYQKLVAIPLSARRDPRFVDMVNAFTAKHPDGFYATKAKSLLP